MHYEIKESLQPDQPRCVEITLFDDEIETVARAYSEEIKRQYDKGGLDEVDEDYLKLANPNRRVVDEHGRHIRKLTVQNLSCLSLRFALFHYYQNTNKSINQILESGHPIDQLGAYVAERSEYGKKALLLGAEIREKAEEGMKRALGALVELSPLVAAETQSNVELFLAEIDNGR